jgi:hypothetical protein
VTEEQRHDLQIFLDSLDTVDWLAHAGEVHSTWIVVADVVEGFDGWSAEMMKTWSPRTYRLEQRALKVVSSETVDEIFAETAEHIGPPAGAALESYFDRQPNINERGEDFGLWPEVLYSIKRDVAWAAVEHILHEPGFFTDMLKYYRSGRWPCGWSGEYPGGSVAVL